MSLSKEISAITECPICTEPFLDPRVLPCVHTFCLKCLESYGRTRKIDEGLACPLCRAKFDTPFSDLPVNFFILKLIDVNKVARKPNENVSCDACSGPNDEEDDDEEEEEEKEEEESFKMATVYCFDCRQSLCKMCFRVHNKLRHNRCHLVVEFGKKQPDELLKISPTYCEAHQDEIVKFFCSDCQKSICMACYVECHNTHKCGNVAKVAEEFLEQLQEDVTKVTEHIEKCMAEEKELATNKEHFLNLIENKEVLANDIMKEIRELVEALGRRIFENLASVRSVKLKEFEHTSNELRDLLAMMESFKNYSQEVMIKATPADVTRLASMLKKRAAELHAMRLDNDLCTYDIDIRSASIRQHLTNRDENSVGELVIYKNRKDNAEAYLTSSLAALPMQLEADTGILGMTSIGDKLYLLRPEVVQSQRRLLDTGLIQLQLQDIFNCNGTNYHRTHFTQCNFVLFHLKLYYSKASTGRTLELEICDPLLVEADTNMSHLTSSVRFNLDLTEIGQPSNDNQTLKLRSPQKLHVKGIRVMNINIQATANATSLKVTASLLNFSSVNSFSNETIVIPVTPNSTPASPTTVPPSSIVEVYDIKVEASNPGIEECVKPSSIVFLPPMNPTDMVSCSYYDCLYIGDETSSSIHRVDLRAGLTKWPVQSIPNLLSVTSSHTILVTSSQAAKLLEYTTLGVLLREICLTGVIDRPSHSLEVLKDKFMVLNETELYLVSMKEVETNHAATECAEKKIDKVDDITQATELTEGLEATATKVDKGPEEDSARMDDVKEVLGANDVKALDQTVDNVSGAKATNDANILKVVAESVAGIGAAGTEPIRSCKDQFGFIFVMTKTKVHLLSPELKYIRELISLDGFGMGNPKHIHFQPESGQLYVASTAGTKQFLVFQVTEGKVAQSVWKK